MPSLTRLMRGARAVTPLMAVAVISSTVAVPLINSAPAAAAVTQSPGLTPGKALSGTAIRGGAAAATTFGNWRGKPIEVVTDYIGTNSWYSISNVAGQGLTGYWAGLNAHRVWSVPLIPSDGSSSLETAATGAYDANYAKVATALIAGGDGNATIRLGWEMTGDWFAWNGVSNPAAFAGAFRHAVTAMRGVAGAHFTYDFNFAMHAANPAPMYPGDDYVDIIGADNYDTSWAWNFLPSDHVKVWNDILTESYGLNWLASFAATHGKRISMPEWGVAYKCDGHGGLDDPYFIDAVHDWVANHDVAYESYFESDDNSCSRFMLTSGLFPNAAKEYQKVFSTQVTPPTTPPTTTANPNASPSIRSRCPTPRFSCILIGIPLPGLKEHAA